MAFCQEKSSIGNYAHHHFIVRRALAPAILLKPSHISLRSSSSLAVETERADTPTPSVLAVANMNRACLRKSTP